MNKKVLITSMFWLLLSSSRPPLSLTLPSSSCVGWGWARGQDTAAEVTPADQRYFPYHAVVISIKTEKWGVDVFFQNSHVLGLAEHWSAAGKLLLLHYYFLPLSLHLPNCLHLDPWGFLSSLLFPYHWEEWASDKMVTYLLARITPPQAGKTKKFH